MTHLTTTTIAGPVAAEYHLLDAGTPAPSLHPNTTVPDRGYSPPYRWSGWNKSVAVGLDANGLPVTIFLWHYADGHVHYAIDSPAVTGPTLSSNSEQVFGQLAYPLEVLPAVRQINSPEWTPGEDGRPMDLPGWRAGVELLRFNLGQFREDLREAEEAAFVRRVDAVTLGRW